MMLWTSKNLKRFCMSEYSETSLIRHSMGPENNVGLGGCWIMECLLPYLCMVTVPHIMVGLERMLDYRGVGLARFHCMLYVHYTPQYVVCRLYMSVCCMYTIHLSMLYVYYTYIHFSTFAVLYVLVRM